MNTLFDRCSNQWSYSSRRSPGPRSLATDYVRNDLDLTTMERANEAARSAVNGILEAAGSSRHACRIETLYRPPEFEPFKAQDAIDYRLGRPNVFDVIH